MAKDYYQILGISRGAGDDDVRKAFKKLARQYHPDVNPGDKKAEEKFKEASEAYQVLSDKEKRKQYDMYGSADFQGFSGRRGGSGNPFSGFQGGMSQDDLGDIFSDIFGAGGFGFSGKQKAGKRRPGFGGMHPEPERGKDFTYKMELDFLEAARGVEKKVRLANGVAFNVKIPAGVDETSKIRLSGKGEPGHYGGEAGDVYIEVHVKPHAYFKRVDDDVELVLPVTLTEALAGAKVRVPTLEGSVDLKIPAKAKSGQKMRLKGKGIVNSKTGNAGDLFVILQVEVPTQLDHETTDKLITLLKDKEVNPRDKMF